MQKIEILQIIPTLAMGGAEKFVIDLARSLNNEIFRVTVLSLYSDQQADTIRLNEINKYGINVIFLHKRQGFDLKLLFELNQIINKIKPDVIHTHLNANVYIQLIKNNRYVRAHIHTVHSIANKEIGAIHKVIMKPAYQKTRVIPVAISRTIQESICRIYNLSIGRVSCIENGVDTQLFYSAKHNFQNDEVKLIHVGSFTPVKNHMLLIDAFAAVKAEVTKKITLTLVGDGPLRAQIEKKILNMNLVDEIILIGNTADVGKYLRGADIFVMTSNYEGMPLAMLEAMASGLPIITTAAGGVVDIVSGNGIVVPCNDVSALCRAIHRLSDNPQLMAQFSCCSRREAEKRDLKIMAQQYEDLYHDLCK